MNNLRPETENDPLPSLGFVELKTEIKVLIVDDSESDRATYARYLQDPENVYHIIESDTLEEGLELWRSQQPDIVLLDLNLPDGDGLEFLEAVNIDRAGDRIPVIMLTGQGNEKMAVNAMKLGASDYLLKGDVTAKSLSTSIRQVARETALGQQLKRSQQQQILIAEIALRMREFLNLEDISNAIVKEVRQFFNADRAAVYKFNSDMSGTVVAEDIISPWQPCLNEQVEDTCFPENFHGKSCESKVCVVNDIYTANLTDCHLQMLERFQVRANLVVPILLSNAEQLTSWGLLIIHQCSAPRIWLESDVQLLKQLAVQLAISIKQAIAYQQVQIELTERKRAEQALQELNQSLETKVTERTQKLWQVNQLQRAILDGTDYAIISTDLAGIIQTFNAGAEKIWGYSMGEVIGQVTPEIFHDAQEVSDKAAKHSKILGKDIGVGFEALKYMATEGILDEEWIHIRKDGSSFPVALSVTLLRDDNGQIIGSVSFAKDISDRKQAEQIILQQANRETLLRGITQRIRQSLDLSIIFDTACHEIQQLLKCDRVGIFKFYPESNFNDGEFVAESVVDGFSSAMEVHIHDHCFGEGYAAAYAQGRMQVVNDIDNAGLKDCHRDVLAKFQIRANLVIPLLCGNNLWGLLCIHQCAHTRQWQEHEINLIQQIAIQLAIAIQQASLYEQLQEELLIGQQSQSKIAQQLREQQTLATITNKIRESLSIKEILAVVTQQVKDVLSGDRVIAFQLFDNGNSQIVEESVHSNFPNLKALNWEDEVWSQEILNCYWQGKPRIIPDVMNDIWTECLVEYSIQGQIKSKIIAPILVESDISENHRWVATKGSKKLCGILVVHACAEPREWQESEAQLLQQIGNQLAIAIQQASLYEQVQADLSIRKQTEIQLLKVNDELLRATKLKDEFLANMSHELRTPLNSILGLSNVLGEQVLGSLNERQIKAIGTVESSGEHLLSLINDILDLSKISSGMMELDVESVLVKNLCDSSLVFVKQQAFQKQVQIASNIPKNINKINVEERRIRQVLINLLTNAVKFTPSEGQVNLLVAVGRGDTWQGEATIPQRIKLMNSPMIVFQVVDTGIGIAANDLQRLFQPFVQVSSSLNRQYEGTGLGLALVKQIVELHGGQVMAESEVGKGSCFSVALPYEMSQSSAPESTTVSTTLTPIVIDPDNAPLILLVEDNEANIQTFTSYLTAINYRIVIARNGIEAVAMAKSESPDIILMDIQMPDMDGLEAIALIRADETIAAIPIIALTALAMEGDRERCLAAGANEYLSKPIKFRQLNSAIQQIL